MPLDSTDGLFDITGLLPPLAKETAAKLLGPEFSGSSGSHTYLPRLISYEAFAQSVLPNLEKCLSPEMTKFVVNRVNETFRIRKVLGRLKNEIDALVGPGNFSALWIDREAYSADSMEHRALVTEAVIHIYDSLALQRIVQLLYKNDVPMIPYGEGGGYNMGVTPMAPAVTISVRGIDHISEIRPSRRRPGSFEVTVGAGVPFKDLQEYLAKRGYVLRCDPNTPRAATGGIVATGSNGGRKIFEVVLEGRAISGMGTAVRFAVDQKEQECIDSEPFLMAKKFFSIFNAQEFKNLVSRSFAKRFQATIHPGCQEVTIPLIGMKASANMAAQRAENLKKSTARAQLHGSKQRDELGESQPLPTSAFVGAEGSTGFIYEVTLEIERPKPWIIGARLHFSDVAAAMAATREIKGFASESLPEFFEIITGASIRRFLVHDFPSVFDGKDEAVLFVGIEGATDTECNQRISLLLERVRSAMAGTIVVNNDDSTQDNRLRSVYLTHPEFQNQGRSEFEAMIRPREALPKKLRTKCKTDMEIRTEYLADVLKLVNETKLKGAGTAAAPAVNKEDVMFGHLTPRKTAIIHWNIGGFDLYNEESAHAAWDYLEGVIGKAQNLAHSADPYPSASFSGEHGIAGKAAFLWLNHLDPSDFERMCQVKEALDPKGLYNPETLFLRSSVSRALRARLIAFGTQKIESLLELHEGEKKQKEATEESQALQFATSEAMKCTRCNSCKICPVIDAEHELRRENPAAYKDSVLPSKRNLVMFLEWVAALKRSKATRSQETALRSMFQEASKLLAKCFYCRKCDKACPVDINIHPMVSAFQKMGQIRNNSSFMFRFLYERLMGEDFFKDYTYKIFGFFVLLGSPVFRFLNTLSFIPDWLKSYFSPPQFAFQAYEATAHGSKAATNDNFVLISGAQETNYRALDNDTAAGKNIEAACEQEETFNVYIRYRGCMDTYSNPQASESVDRYFKEYLGARFVDLEKKMCCGFPFEADGLSERAERSRMLSLAEIAKCIRIVSERTSHSAGAVSLSKTTHILFTVFSNCPTCTEAIKEMKQQLLNEACREKVRLSAGLPPDFNWDYLNFQVRDTAELAVDLLSEIKKRNEQGNKFSKRHALKQSFRVTKDVGLKVPCHNTPEATKAQVELLKMYYTGVSAYDRCCGLSGTGRLKHPKIGTKISEKLFEQIREAQPNAVVSGCPSCRDGVTIQKNLLAGRKDKVAQFEVAGIFEQILKDQPKALSKN